MGMKFQNDDQENVTMLMYQICNNFEKNPKGSEQALKLQIFRTVER